VSTGKTQMQSFSKWKAGGRLKGFGVPQNAKVAGYGQKENWSLGESPRRTSFECENLDPKLINLSQMGVPSLRIQKGTQEKKKIVGNVEAPGRKEHRKQSCSE